MKPKFKITAVYDSGHSQSAEYYQKKALEYAVRITLMEDMRGVKKVVIERIDKEGDTDER